MKPDEERVLDVLHEDAALSHDMPLLQTETHTYRGVYATNDNRVIINGDLV